MINKYINIKISIINKNINNKLKEYRKSDIINKGLNYYLDDIIDIDNIDFKYNLHDYEGIFKNVKNFIIENDIININDIKINIFEISENKRTLQY